MFSPGESPARRPRTPVPCVVRLICASFGLHAFLPSLEEGGIVSCCVGRLIYNWTP